MKRHSKALTGIQFLTVFVQFSLQSRVNSSMFLRTIGSRLSIQRGALLLRRVPIRAATGAYKVVVEENGGDMSLVGEGLLFHSSHKTLENWNVSQESLSLIETQLINTVVVAKQNICGRLNKVEISKRR